jgi:hypothetical protein
MPSAGQISFVYDQTRMRWMTSLTSGRFQLPLNLTEGNTIDFVFRLSNNGVLFTPALTPVWIFGIKDADDPNGDFLIQVNSATASSGVFTFVVELASAELQTWLATATSQSYAAIQITDSANDIATGPLLCQIEPNQNDSGTTPTSANGTLNVTAGKTVTFPQSLTFPSALGTNGFQLTTDGAGALTWAAGGALTDGDKGEITVSASGATWTIDNDVVTLAKLAHMPTARVIGRTTGGTGSPELLTISGTGSVAMTNTPTLVTPVLGAATATSINGIPISGDSGTSGIFMTSLAGAISTSSLGGDIDTSGGGGSINTSGTGSIELGVTGTRTTFTGAASGTNKSIALPNLSGTVVVTASVGTTATHALFANTTGFPAYRAIATADIATALTTPGAIGGTTASTGAFTTLTSSSTTDSTTTATGAVQTLGGLGVAKSIFAGGNINIPATTSTAGQITQASTRVFHTYGTNNLFVGSSSGNFTTTGAGGNCGIGNLTLNLLQGGQRNMAIGSTALQKVTSGNDNIGIGEAAGNSLTSGSANTLVGSSAAANLVSGSNNAAIGFQSMFVATGSSNVAVGVYSGYSVSSGGSNVLLGMHAGRAELGGAAITSGSFNTMLGDQTSAFLATGSYQTAIGAGAICTAINQVMIGRSTESVTLPGGLVTVPVAQTATTAAVSVAVTTTALTTTAPAQAITLANGTNGQIKIITHIASSGGGTAVLTPATSAADYNTITFAAVGDTATLQYHTTGGWYILSLRGAVAA